MTTKANAQKDREMASALKKAGVEREVTRCPVCNEIVRVESFPGHIATHK